MLDSPITMMWIGVPVIIFSMLTIWQYGNSLKRQQGQQDLYDVQQARAEAQQARSEAILDRQEALLTRAEELVRQLESRDLS